MFAHTHTERDIKRANICHIFVIKVNNPFNQTQTQDIVHTHTHSQIPYRMCVCVCPTESTATVAPERQLFYCSAVAPNGHLWQLRFIFDFTLAPATTLQRPLAGNDLANIDAL